ncbi:MAG: tRNA uridine-5-carboxymethylaminomethyl(34) synthesis GTPase MnmE [Deltaproteobacteria bacterium]|nr:MAG: tRNA uridine-5-carboxymethylaminomethyl(34) synthesis GTPase MnmE [Deltaproteobacteria bacterium]
MGQEGPALALNSSPDDTIAAIATPPGQAGIGIVRISGPKALAIVKEIFRSKYPRDSFETHRLYLGHLVDPVSGTAIDEVLLSFMKAPHTYTREDIVEINSHSGYLLLSRILKLVMDQGARLARPGEFTFRAFINGRIDLTQAEAVVDIVNSQSEKGLQLVAEQIKGTLRRRIELVKDAAVEILAHAEVAIDFPEEDHEILSREEGMNRIKEKLLEPLRVLIADHKSRNIWVDGINTVIVGRVNVGKSSLLNRLLNETRAIVTPVPGTTRDIIESPLSIEGIPLRLVDTAGLRQGTDQVERIGIHLTRQKMQSADLILLVFDQSEHLQQEDKKILDQCRSRNVIIVLNKIDLPGGLLPKERELLASEFPTVAVSALTGQGMDRLKQAIVNFVLKDGPDLGDSNVAPNLRHRKALEEALACFTRAAGGLKKSLPMEIVALELRSGIDALGEIIGETTPEHVLESIFSQFCMGK